MPAEKPTWQERFRKLGIAEGDLVEKFIRGSGPGGQKINKTSGTVLLIHRPSGIEVRCQESRSRAANRDLARERLCDALKAKANAKAQADRDAKEKDRRRTRDKPASLKRRQLEIKHHRSRIKSNRRWKGSD